MVDSYKIAPVSLSVKINNGHPVAPKTSNIGCNRYELLSAHEPTTTVRVMSLRAVAIAHTRAYSTPESGKTM